MEIIKISVPEEMKQKLQAEAMGKEISLSKYVREILERRWQQTSSQQIGKYVQIEDPDIQHDLDLTDCVDFVVHIPRELNDAIGRKATKLGMQKGLYITTLLAQKNKPVILTIDLPSKLMFSQKINDLLSEIDDIARTVTRSRKIYPAEFRLLESDLREAVKEFLKEGTRRDSDTRKACNRIMSKITHIKQQ